MKKSLLMVFILLLAISSHAQSNRRFSIELDMARLARPHGLFEANNYDYAFSFLNGARLIYQKTEKWGAFVGVRRLPFRIQEDGGFTQESGDVSGMEVRVGALFSPHQARRLSLSYGLELFREGGKIDGRFEPDFPPSYEILYKKSFIGIAPSLLLRFALTKRLSLVADTRLQFGQVFFQPLESNPATQEQFVTTNYAMNTWNPLNSLSLRIAL